MNTKVSKYEVENKFKINLDPNRISRTFVLSSGDLDQLTEFNNTTVKVDNKEDISSKTA